VIAVDSNLLVYAHRADSPWHDTAKPALAGLVESGAAWAIPWPCVHEFLAIVTHPAIFKPPTPIEAALAQVDAWLEAPTLELLGEVEGYWPLARATFEDSKVAGPRVHDARIAAICIQHGVESLWSADRDFGRFAGLRVRNPLLASQVSERTPRYGRRRRRS
jgi:hypothetical protein